MYTTSILKVWNVDERNQRISQYIMHSRVGRLKIIKMSTLSKLICKYYKIPIKISDILFCKYREDYFEIYMKKHKN